MLDFFLVGALRITFLLELFFSLESFDGFYSCLLAFDSCGLTTARLLELCLDMVSFLLGCDCYRLFYLAIAEGTVFGVSAPDD